MIDDESLYPRQNLIDGDYSQNKKFNFYKLNFETRAKFIYELIMSWPSRPLIFCPCGLLVNFLHN